MFSARQEAALETPSSVKRLLSAFGHAGMFCFCLIALLALTINTSIGRLLEAVIFFSPIAFLVATLNYGQHMMEASYLGLAIFLPYPVIGFIWGLVLPVPVTRIRELFVISFLRFLAAFAVLAAAGIIMMILVAANDS